MSLSRDGQWIYFDSNLHGNQDLYRIPAVGGTIEQLTTNPGDDFHPDPSPDDHELAFHAVRNGTRDILVMPSGGGAETPVYAGPYEERWGHWSPDGSAIAFCVTEAAANQVGLHVTRRATDGSWGAPKRISPREVQGHWTPDGRALLLEAGFADWDNLRLIHHIPRVWVETGRTDSLPLPIDDAIYAGIRLAPDGHELFLRIVGLGGEVSFWAMRISGGAPRLLLRVPGTEIGGRGYWATDGKRLYFTRTERESDVFVAEVIR